MRPTAWAAFARGLAERGVNAVLLARRQSVLDDVAAQIVSATSVQARTLAVDLAATGAAAAIAETTADLEIGFLVYCAGADLDRGRGVAGRYADAGLTAP